MNPKALEKELNALKEVDEHIVTRPDILRCLLTIGVRRVDDEVNDKKRTVRRTPIPVKTALAGGNGCMMTL